jgi:hypothetical protein
LNPSGYFSLQRGQPDVISVPLEEVSKLLGHESIKTTERHYSKWMKGRQDRPDKSRYGFLGQEEAVASAHNLQKEPLR